MENKVKLSVFFDHVLQAQEQTGKTLELLLSEVKDAGIEAVEINLQYLWEHEKKILPLFKEKGLAVSCIYEFYDMGRCDETKKAQQHINMAVHTGAKRILVVPGFLSGDASVKMQQSLLSEEQTKVFFHRNEEIRKMKEALDVLTGVGRKNGVIVTVEDFDDRNSPFSGLHGVHWFLTQVPELGYTLDTGNYLFYGDNVLEAMERLKSRIVHVHCKDRNPVNFASVRTGSGCIPLEEILSRLNEQGYRSYLAIEHFDVDEQEVCIRQSAEFLKKTLWSFLR